jgi:hypothetical protein
MDKMIISCMMCAADGCERHAGKVGPASVKPRGGSVIMAAYKIDGAKFQTIEELKESLWPLYQAKMTREEFDRYVQENVKEAG